MSQPQQARPHRFRNCPVAGCDWTQVTSWWLTPALDTPVDPAVLERGAVAHLLTHAAPEETIFT